MICESDVILGRGGVFAGAEECTEKEFLKQKLPNVPSSGKYLSSCAECHIWRPVHVQPWDVIRDIEDFVKIADTEKHVVSIFPQHFMREFKDGDEVFVTWCLMMEIQLFMAQKYPQIDFTFNKEVALAVFSSLSGCHKKDFLPNFYAQDPQADFVMSVGSKNLLVFDVKGGGLGTDGLEDWPLHKARACSCNSGFIWPPISSLDLYKFAICCKNAQMLMKFGIFFAGIVDTCWCKDIPRGVAGKLQGCIMQVYEHLVL